MFDTPGIAASPSDSSAITTQTTPNALTISEVQACLATLEAIVGDRSLLAPLPEELRRRLLVAAGRASRPSKIELTKFARALRRERRQGQAQKDRAARASTGIREARQASVFVAPAEQLGVSLPDLENPRRCYVCKADYRKLHFFYDNLCPDCAAFNYAKRFQSASLEGRTALITGARLKIGYQAALKMLRAGARVIVTTRFPQDAALRFAQEPDFSEWRTRLHVHGLDLRHAPSVEVFARFIETRHERLDILINNAAQTVRRPPGFYAHLLPVESKRWAELPGMVQPLLSDHEGLKDRLGLAPQTPLIPGQPQGPGAGISYSAALSQYRAIDEDFTAGSELFPEGRRDADLQQIDLRLTNSWRLTLAEVATPEMLEVQLVNAVAPFILCAKLKPLMLRHRTNEKHIVNVSAMEGKFSRYTKTDKHPHTNMAKAALNMMTLTSAPDYAKDGIFMNAVDTGWVTDEDPAQHVARKQAECDFQPPLDIVDGAARICDPFFSGLLTGTHVYGKFLKDYAPTDW